MTEYTPGQAVEFFYDQDWEPGRYVGVRMWDRELVIEGAAGRLVVVLPADVRPARRSAEEIALEAVDLIGDCLDIVERGPDGRQWCVEESCEECEAALRHALILAAIREHEENKR
jgi:hypothetical protein